jgi:hypothetical protein
MEGMMQQLNVRFLNPPQPTNADRFVEKASRVHALARTWAVEADEAKLADLLAPAAGALVTALLAQIAARKTLEPDAVRLVRDVLRACEVARDAQPLLTEARRTTVQIILERRDALQAVAAVIDEALDLAAAIRSSEELVRR